MARIGGVAASLVGIAVVGALVYLPVWLARHDPPPVQITRTPAQTVLADVPDATLVGRDSGHKIWQIHARDIQAAADGHTTTFVGVDHGTLYRNDRPAAHVTAGRVVYHDGTRILRASGGLTLSADDVTVSTERLNWGARTGRVLCPAAVNARWPGGSAHSDGLQADVGLRRLMFRNVSMVSRLEGPMFQKLARRVGAASVAVMAVSLTQPAANAAPPAGYSEVRIVHADTGESDQRTRIHILDGHVTAIHGDTTLQADHLYFDEGRQKATLTGHIVVENPLNRVEGDVADVDFKLKKVQVRAQDGVKIVTRPKPSTKPEDPKAKVKGPTTIVCKVLDYFYKEKRAEATGPLTLTNQNHTMTGTSATYLASDESVVITGHVRGKDDRNQTFEAPSVKLNLKDGAESLEAPNFSGTFYVKDEDVEPAKTAKAPG